MNTINNCIRFDVHTTGAEGAMNFPIAGPKLIFAARGAAEAIGMARTYQNLLVAIGDKVRDLKANYTCTNNNCRIVVVEVDWKSVRLELVHSVQRGANWHAHYRATVDLRVRCRRVANPPPDPTPDPRPEEETYVTDPVNSAEWPEDAVVEQALKDFAEAFSAGKPDCGC